MTVRQSQKSKIVLCLLLKKYHKTMDAFHSFFTYQATVKVLYFHRQNYFICVNNLNKLMLNVQRSSNICIIIHKKKVQLMLKLFFSLFSCQIALFQYYFMKQNHLLNAIYTVQNQFNPLENMENKKLLQDRFKVTDIDPNNKNSFKNVSRVHMKSDYGILLEVDINSNIYPVYKSDSFLLKITGSQNLGKIYAHDELNKPSQRDNYDYVSYGVVVQIKVQEKNNNLIVFASFGGLIMRLQGKVQSLSGFKNQERILFMMRKA